MANKFQNNNRKGRLNGNECETVEAKSESKRKEF